jgi:hypothetical protein
MDIFFQFPPAGNLIISEPQTEDTVALDEDDFKHMLETVKKEKPEWLSAKISPDDIKLIKTCDACPEQYDAFYKDEQVGYLRLRFGIFTVQAPDHKNTIVFQQEFPGDYKGNFTDEEREFYLDCAKQAIIEFYIKKEKPEWLENET